MSTHVEDSKQEQGWRGHSVVTVFVVVLEDRVSIPSTHMAVYNPLLTLMGIRCLLLIAAGIKHTSGVYTYMQAKTVT